MSPRGLLGWVVVAGFPRVSGDEPGFEVGVEVLRRFSPRERG